MVQINLKVIYNIFFTPGLMTSIRPILFLMVLYNQILILYLQLARECDGYILLDEGGDDTLPILEDDGGVGDVIPDLEPKPVDLLGGILKKAYDNLQVKYKLYGRNQHGSIHWNDKEGSYLNLQLTQDVKNGIYCYSVHHCT